MSTTLGHNVIANLEVDTTVSPAIRGTLIGSSLQAMRERSLNDDYFAVLDPMHHEAIRTLVPQSWVEMPLAMAHYRAMDTLITSNEEVLAIGRAVGDRVQKSYIATLIRGLKATGAVDPARVLSRAPSISERIFRGGGVKVLRDGPKDISVHFIGVPLCAVRYFRWGFGGVVQGGLELVVRRVYVTPRQTSETSMALKVSWV
ncbi:MAG: hypothetical protein KBB95_10615 [Deltaproteobacteria bacterium]|nr:hypothetical protein [Deltaproteobacteria bacterium]